MGLQLVYRDAQIPVRKQIQLQRHLKARVGVDLRCSRCHHGAHDRQYASSVSSLGLLTYFHAR